MKNSNMANILWSLAKTMNKNWIEASRNVAQSCQDSEEPLKKYEYLDVMGLFETDWMIFDHLAHLADYGYPGT